MSRFLKVFGLLTATLMLAACGGSQAQQPSKVQAAQVQPTKVQTNATPKTKAIVYYTKDLSAQGLKKIYAKVNQDITGKVAIKLHTGEPHGPYILPREWVKELQESIPQSTLVETNVLYGSPRQNTPTHRETLKTNGWTFSKVDIMDEEGTKMLPIKGGKHLKEISVGSHMLNYDSLVVLTHFKGHTMGGFGGSLKNIGIGCADGKIGKAQVHHGGGTNWEGGERFMERMVESGKGTIDHFAPHITYINVLRCMSVDCDCAGTGAAAPKLPDLGILASKDILALDKASVDMALAQPKEQSQDLKERIESRQGLRQLTYMQELGMGNAEYELVEVK